MVNCATIEIPDIKPGIVLPASGDLYQISTISHKETRTLAEDAKNKIPRAILLFSDDWAKLKFTLLKNCIANECKQTVGTLDNLFIVIDNALKQIP